MNLKTIYYTICRAAMSIALVATVLGCAFVGDDYPAEREGGGFYLSVNVITSSAVTTRADHTDDWEEEGIPAENFIDFDNNDFKIVVFDLSGNYLTDVDSEDYSWVTQIRYDENYVYYTLETELVFPQDIDPAILNAVKRNGVQIMALANWKAADSSAGYDAIFANSNNTHQNLSEIWKDGTHNNFSYATTATGQSWRPDIASGRKKLIPVFGLAKTTPFTPRSSGTSFYSMVTVPMQRAMAKIEVLDNITQEGISVEEVTMNEFNTSGRFIPDLDLNRKWSEIGSQVGVSSLPTNVTKQAGLTFVKEGDKKWVAYVPEMRLDPPVPDTKGDFQTTRTHLNVKVAGNIPGIFEGNTYPVHFALYDPTTFLPTVPDDSWNHILRNHIYRFSVSKVGIEARIHLHVIPWDLDEDEVWDFTDNVTVSKLLEWEEETYDMLNNENGEVLLSLDREKILKGVFKFMSPVNGRWYARLTPIGSSKVDAVTFVDEGNKVIGGGDVCMEVSGLIKNDEGYSVIYIRPSSTDNEEESLFRLDFFVENINGWMEVPMIPDGSPTFYTIVRPSNLFE